MVRRIRRTWRKGVPYLALPWTYTSSAVKARCHRDLFSDVGAYCFFIGYPRSGHSLTGALLDAHPDIVVGHELHAMRYVALGFRREQIFELLLERSRWFARRGSVWNRYCYAVPGQWQGRFRSLRVVGDKKGGGTTFWLGTRPELLDRLRSVVGVPIRAIHVVRNPFDNIATILRRRQSGVRNLDEASRLYFRLCRSVDALKSVLAPDEILDIRHEEFVRDPESGLRRLGAFLGVDLPGDYLRACTAIVFDRPRTTRGRLEWPDPVVRDIRESIDRHGFLGGYELREDA